MMSLSKAVIFFFILFVSDFAIAEPDASSNDENDAAQQKLLTPSKIKSAKIVAENSIDPLDIDQITLLTLMSNLTSVSDAELEIAIKSLYTNLKENGAINLSGEMAKFAVLLKAMVPALCQGGEGSSAVDKDGKIMSPVDLGVSHLFDLAETGDIRGLSIISDRNTLDKDNSVSLAKELMPLLVMSKLVCNALNKRSLLVSEANLILNRAGYQSGSVIVMDPANPAIDELRDLVGNPFNQTGEEYQAGVDKAIAQHAEHGHVEVADYHIMDIEADYELFGSDMETVDKVTERLAFLPSPLIVEPGFRFLGASAGGASTDSGLTDIFSTYDSPLGKIKLAEADLITSQGEVYIDAATLNTTVGAHIASMAVLKSEKSGAYNTAVLWVNENTSRFFTVTVGGNLNAEGQQENKALLMRVLEKHYGAF